MQKITFMCELPAPYGGVTVKNQLLLDTIFNDIENINVIDFCKVKRNPLNAVPVFAQMIWAFLRKDTVVYGFGSKSRLKIALTIQKLLAGKSNLHKCVNIVMGGRIAHDIAEDPFYEKLLKQLKINLVETQEMKAALHNKGLTNVAVFPNPKPQARSRMPKESDGLLKCVFFSRICKEKGVDYIISEFNEMTDHEATLDFFGPIDSEIKERFMSFVENHSNVRYCGVFDSAKNDIYGELNKYDVLLFPTTWPGEGVPGILVEAKMAGIVPIVSDWKYNSEIVIDNKEGIVLENLDAGTLVDTLTELNKDRAILKKLKMGSFLSRERYAIETYVEYISNLIAN